jgi:hypothetical protein
VTPLKAPHTLLFCTLVVHIFADLRAIAQPSLNPAARGIASVASTVWPAIISALT